MIKDQMELELQRRQTAALIEADHEIITLRRFEKQRTAAGGFKWIELPPRKPQKFKVVEMAYRARIDIRVAGGERRAEEYVLIGTWDAEISRDDRFDLYGTEWEVAAIEYPYGYEVRAAVIRYGGGV